MNATGYMGARLEDMSADERKKLVESGTLTETQKGLIENYERLMADKSEKLGYADAVHSSKRGRDAAGQRLKNRFKAGSRAGNRIHSKLLKSEEADAHSGGAPSQRHHKGGRISV